MPQLVPVAHIRFTLKEGDLVLRGPNVWQECQQHLQNWKQLNLRQIPFEVQWEDGMRFSSTCTPSPDVHLGQQTHACLQFFSASSGIHFGLRESTTGGTARQMMQVLVTHDFGFINPEKHPWGDRKK